MATAITLKLTETTYPELFAPGSRHPWKGGIRYHYAAADCACRVTLTNPLEDWGEKVLLEPCAAHELGCLAPDSHINRAASAALATITPR